ncbi:MAG: hypothetical protein AMXMBFR34_26750 [Myxococcaceae bacterium]
MRWALLFVSLCSCAHQLEGAPAVANITLPADHGAHLAQTEWWHFHGHLRDARGRKYDFFLGFVRWHTDGDRFLGVPVRLAVDPGQVAVFCVTDEHGRRYFGREKYAFPDVWAASAATGRLELSHDDWTAKGTARGMALSASTRDAELSLTLGEGKPVVLEGEGGRFVADGTAHLFYTLPRLPASGALTLDGERVAVTGEAWVKHEWGFLYSERIAGWTWFGAQFDDGTELQIGLIRDHEWREVDGSFAELIEADGAVRRLELTRVGVMQTGEAWTSPSTSITWPVRWRLELPEERGVLELTTDVPQQELDAFPAAIWAGSFAVRGELRGRAVRGRAMVEVFGLSQPYLRRFFSSGPPPEETQR